MQIKKLVIAVVGAVALAGCEKGSVTSSDVTTETSSGVTRDASIAKTKELTATKQQMVAITLPLLPILWTELANFDGPKPVRGDLVNLICDASAMPREKYHNEVQPQLKKMWADVRNDPDLVGWEQFQKPQDKLNRVCAALITGGLFGRNYGGWVLSSNPFTKEADAERREIMTTWLYAADPAVTYLETVAQAVTAQRGLSEGQYRQLVQEELEKAAPAFVEAFTQKYQTRPQANYTVDQAGFQGMRFLANTSEANYDFQGTEGGTVIYKNGSVYLGGDNFINGKQYTLRVVQSDSASMNRSSGTTSTNTNQVSGGVEGRAGTQ